MLRFNDTLGKRVRLLRQYHNLNQEHLIDLMLQQSNVRVGQGYISDIERDRADPTWRVVAALAKALGTTTDYLTLLTDDTERTQTDENRLETALVTA